MLRAILGKKLGMTQVFDSNGYVKAVTLVHIEDNVILQKKTIENDGYLSLQLGYLDKKNNQVKKTEVGHFKKSNTNPKKFVREIRYSLEDDYTKNLKVGDVLNAAMFKEGDFVDVTGTSKGKGFAGSIKRHNQSRGPMSHGSRYHRGPGSMEPIKGKLKGKNLPGHMGAEKTTVQNLRVFNVDLENNVLLISGHIPGPKHGMVIIKDSVKKNVKGAQNA